MKKYKEFCDFIMYLLMIRCRQIVTNTYLNLRDFQHVNSQVKSPVELAGVDIHC